MSTFRRPVHFRRSKVPRRRNIKKEKINTAVLFVVIFVIVCIIGTVMLGNHLKSKAENTDVPEETPPPETEEETTRASEGLSMIEPADGGIRSGCLDISGIEDVTELDEKIRFIFASGYDSVTVPISKDGALLYHSPAAIALSHTQKDSVLPSLTDIINRIRTIADEYKLEPTVTAYYTLTSPNTEDPVLMEAAFLFDTAIVSEAYTLGADEVLVSGFTLDDVSEENSSAVISFIDKLTISSPDIKVGIALPPDAYMTDATAYSLEVISAKVKFLAVETSHINWTHTVSEETVYYTDENGNTSERIESVHISTVYNSISEIAEAIKGSTSLYGLRFLLNGNDTYTLMEAVNALSAKNAHDFYITTPIPSMSADTGNNTETDDEDETTKGKTTEKEDTKKPETKPPETTEKATTETETETETETTINPENWEWILG